MRELLDIPIDELFPDPTQPRTHFSKAEIERLAASIDAREILQPLRVMRDEDRQAWIIVVGEGRWRAAKLAGKKTVPCLVVERASEVDLLIDRLVENQVRCNLSPIDEARAIAKLKALKKCTAQTLAKELGFSGAQLSRTERLLMLPESIQNQVADGSVPESIGYVITRLTDEADQREVADAVAANKMNRKAVEAVVADKLGKGKPGKASKPKGLHLSCQVEGMAVKVAAKSLLKHDQVIAALSELIETLKTLKQDGKPVSELSKLFKLS